MKRDRDIVKNEQPLFHSTSTFALGVAQARHDRNIVETFDRSNIRAFASNCQRDAGASRGAVDLDRTGAANAVLATDMRAGQQLSLA